MDHVEFFEIGTELDFNDSEHFTEVKVRNSLGRIYYYTYHEALKLVRDDTELFNIYTELEVSIPSFHKRLMHVFMECARRTQNLKFGTICRLLGVLHSLRCDADYDLDKSVGRSHFVTMLAQFDDLKQAVQTIKPQYFNVSVTSANSTIIETKVEVGTIQVVKRAVPSDQPKKKPSLRLLE